MTNANLINKNYTVNTLSADGSVKSFYTIFAYKIDGNDIRCVKVVNGKKTATSDNYRLKDFLTCLRLGSVTEA